MNKIVSYLGFAQKSGSVIFGVDNLKSYRKKLYLILTCPTSSEDAKKVAIKKQQETGCEIYTTIQPLSDLLNRENCKIIGVKNKELSMAIIGCADAINKIEVK